MQFCSFILRKATFPLAMSNSLWKRCLTGYKLMAFTFELQVRQLNGITASNPITPKLNKRLMAQSFGFGLGTASAAGILLISRSILEKSLAIQYNKKSMHIYSALALILPPAYYQPYTLLFTLPLIYVMYKLALFTQLKVVQFELPQMKLLYFIYRGPYKDVGAQFMKLHNETTRQFTGAPMIGVYFDDPDKVVGKDCRSVVGIRVQEQYKVEAFLRGHPEWRFGKFGPVKALRVRYPFWSKIGIIVMIKRAIPVLVKEGQRRLYPDETLIIELYETQQQGDSFIDFIKPSQQEQLNNLLS